jgi:hypothetical protein
MGRRVVCTPEPGNRSGGLEHHTAAFGVLAPLVMLDLIQSGSRNCRRSSASGRFGTADVAANVRSSSIPTKCVNGCLPVGASAREGSKPFYDTRVAAVVVLSDPSRRPRISGRPACVSGDGVS